MKPKHLTLTVVMLFIFQFIFSQEKNTIEVKKVEINGNLLYNKINGNIYFTKNDCDDNKIVKLGTDLDQWEIDLRTFGGSKLQQKMMLGMMSKEQKEARSNNEAHFLKNIKNILDPIFEYSNNPYEIIKKGTKNDKIYYVDSRYQTYPLIEGEFVASNDGNFMVSSKDSFRITYKSEISKDPVILFSGDINQFNFNNVSSISFFQYEKVLSIVVKNNNKYSVRAYNTLHNVFYPESFESDFNFSKVNFSMRGLKVVPELITVSSINDESKYVLLNKNEISDLNKKGEFNTPKKLISSIDTLRKYSKDLLSFLFSGGKYEYNDTLIALNNFENHSFSGYYSESENNFLLTSYPFDATMKMNDFSGTKQTFDELIEFCPSAPFVIKEIANLNQQLEETKRKGNIDDARMKKFQFKIEEVKDAKGAEITEIKILKDCKLFELSDSSNRKAISELVEEVRKNRQEAIGNLSNALTKFTKLLADVKMLCTVTEDIDTGGSKLLGGLSKIADKASKGVLQAQLVGTITKTTELFNSYKASKEQLDNAKKAIENYKEATK